MKGGRQRQFRRRVRYWFRGTIRSIVRKGWNEEEIKVVDNLHVPDVKGIVDTPVLLVKKIPLIDGLDDGCCTRAGNQHVRNDRCSFREKLALLQVTKTKNSDQ